MNNANMMRVISRSESYAGNGNSHQDKRQQHRQKVLALFEAINSGNLDAARHAFQALVNFDASTLVDAQFVRLSKFLQAGSIYLAQQLVKEIKSNLANTASQAAAQKKKSQAPALRLDGLHVVDIRA